ncbi:MAG TPA: hypothetical protein VJ183_06330 [Chloroflexia bacterium]|nr:hypothetical protein [Chloroflexia bacterium]
MIVYPGTVKGNVIVLPEGVHLEDGTAVEVRALPAEQQQREQEMEDEFEQHLFEVGLLSEIKPPQPVTLPDGDRTPLKVPGKPLSQMVIEDRR